jgi:hypothetical protein
MEKLIMNNIPNKIVNSFDIDGVIYMGDAFTGVFPGPDDVIITGRSFEESDVTTNMLTNRGIYNKVYMNPLKFDSKTRKSSGQHKARTLFYLEEIGYRFGIHFEDDPIQAEEIRKLMPHINIVMLEHNLTEK